MNQNKMNGKLLMSLLRAQPNTIFSYFVKTVEMTPEQKEELKQLGVNVDQLGIVTIHTGKSSSSQIEEISDKEYVISLSGSEEMRML